MSQVSSKSESIEKAQPDGSGDRKRIRWLPLESNPDMMNTLQQKLGISEKHHWVDVIGFDEELLAFLSQPVHALIFLFPSQDLPSQSNAESAPADQLPPDQWPYFVKQTISNACGMMALLHSVANRLDHLQHDSDGAFPRFVRQTRSMNLYERAAVLEQESEIANAHESSARQGQTETPDLQDSVDFHFVAMVEHDQHVWELDGTKHYPVRHCRVGESGFLSAAASVCRQWMQSHPTLLNFSAMALVDIEP